MLNIGKDAIINNGDDYSIKTADGTHSAHFEHTILITDGEAEILTKI
jgi:methionyl aminopeptidase